MRGAPALARIAAVALLLACGDRGARAPADASSNDLRTRTADPPIQPSAIRSPESVPHPLYGVCLSGDPDHGEPWSVGGLDTALVRGLEGIEAFTPRDSARLVARLARTVDALPSDTGIADFRGLPVVVRAAWRVVLAPDDTLFVATAARRLPIESAPLEEQFTLVAVPVVVPTIREPLRAAWHAREVGPEETLAPREPVSAWVGAEGPRLLLARAGASGPLVELLVRGDGSWRSAWTGALAACAIR